MIQLYRKLPKLISYVNESFSQESRRLGFLSKYESQNGKVPGKYLKVIEGFSQYIAWQSREQKYANGKIQTKKYPVPAKGMHQEYDQAKERVSTIKKELDEYLKYQINKKMFNDFNAVEYVHSKYPYQMEIPEHFLKRVQIPVDFEFTSQRKGFKRYRSAQIIRLVQQLEEAEEFQKEALKPFIVSVFSKFHQERKIWDTLIEIIAEIDCLLSLAFVVLRNQVNFKFCKPRIIESKNDEEDQQPFLQIRELYHPCVAKSGFTQNFIPNDTVIGGQKEANFILVTGPNMGGKSTLLRQTCIAVIMAQIGSYVSASKMNMTIFDRIFTRLGANDKILEGKSTFFVEMQECQSLAANGTKHSLAIMDQVGRGTATYDGFAIASGIMKYIFENIGCLCLFSTHYQKLVEINQSNSRVSFYTMAVKVQKDQNDQDGSEQTQIRFLYKFVKGVSPSSFGLNVAKSAGLNVIFIHLMILQFRNECLNMLRNKPLTTKMQQILRKKNDS